jgi:D-alanyl-D-alanine dipeptidase
MTGRISLKSSRSIWLLLVLTVLLPTAGYAQTPLSKEVGLRKPDLVELTLLDPTLKLDIRYATSNNFLGRPVYKQARAFLQRPAAEALVRVNKRLAKQGLGLKVFDGYRPLYVTKIFWEETSDDKKEFVADPAKGSRHNRGCAVDLTLYSLKTGKDLKMPSEYDEFTERAYSDYKCATSEAQQNRDLLRSVMEEEGFKVYESEWWHFDYKDWPLYPILDVSFSAVDRI